MNQQEIKKRLANMEEKLSSLEATLEEENKKMQEMLDDLDQKFQSLNSMTQKVLVEALKNLNTDIDRVKRWTGKST